MSKNTEFGYAGDVSLIEEIETEDAFGGSVYSNWLAHQQGLGGQGVYCTISAECMGTISCGS